MAQSSAVMKWVEPRSRQDTIRSPARGAPVPFDRCSRAGEVPRPIDGPASVGESTTALAVSDVRVCPSDADSAATPADALSAESPCGATDTTRIPTTAATMRRPRLSLTAAVIQALCMRDSMSHESVSGADLLSDRVLRAEARHRRPAVVKRPSSSFAHPEAFHSRVHQ